MKFNFHLNGKHYFKTADTYTFTVDECEYEDEASQEMLEVILAMLALELEASPATKEGLSLRVETGQ